MTIAGLLLAAGEGARFGRPKALVEWEGERLVDRGVRVLREGGCRPIVVVIGAVDVMVPGVVAVHNPRWRQGMGTSLRVGLSALPAGAEAVVVALVDQPLIGVEAVRRLRAAFEAGAEVAVATYGGARRNPVLLARAHWGSAARLAEGDVGARPFLRANEHLVTPVPCADCADPADVDTPEDLRRLGSGGPAHHDRPSREG